MAQNKHMIWLRIKLRNATILWETETI